LIGAGYLEECSQADQIKKAIAYDPELVKFFQELQRRDKLLLMMKHFSDLPDDKIKHLIRIIKTF